MSERPLSKKAVFDKARLEQDAQKKREEELVNEVQRDFADRREQRRSIETQWLLNINFMLGNQYSYIAANGSISDEDKRFYWQEREVFNHIAPIIEARLAKFTRVNAHVNVRPSGASDNDVNTAKLASKLIEAAELDNGFVSLAAEANYWAELTGTAFFKVVWNSGRKSSSFAAVGEDNKGNVELSVCPPYEIYPDTLGAADVDCCRSIIHAKAYPVETIKDIWDVDVNGGDVSVINMSINSASYPGNQPKVCCDTRAKHAIVIEKYIAPSKVRPNGRVIMVAEDKLLYDGELPFENGDNKTRGFPFIRQTAFVQPGAFFGLSLIERLIPIQRAYNAVKNRKHEFISRLSAGVLAVEDGSVDIENLEEEGLSPGKVLVYRQGSTPPIVMSAGNVPSELRDEEDRLLTEFVTVSGINEMLSNSAITSNISGYALSLLVEQDFSRLSVTTESIRNAVRNVAKHVLRLYRQFGQSERLLKISGDNGMTEILSFLGSDLNADDVVLEADSEIIETPAVRKSKVQELLQLGLLSDENGKLSNRNKAKALQMLGFGNWESTRSLDEVHIKKCALENDELSKAKDCGIEDVDDHAIHVEEHARFLVSGRDSLSPAAKDIINAHIRAHKVLQRLQLKAQTITENTNGGANNG